MRDVSEFTFFLVASIAYRIKPTFHDQPETEVIRGVCRKAWRFARAAVRPARGFWPRARKRPAGCFIS
jgi:hypothetical protein